MENSKKIKLDIGSGRKTTDGHIELNSKNMKRIQWQYRHHLNKHSSLIRTKEGDYYGKVKHTRRHWNRMGDQMAHVQFDGNKRTSIVPLKELKFL